MAEKDFYKMTFSEKMKWLSDNLIVIGISLIMVGFALYLLMRKGG